MKLFQLAIIFTDMNSNIENSLANQTFSSGNHTPEVLAHVAEFLQKQYDHLMQESNDLKARQTKHSRWVRKFVEDLKNLKTLADATDIFRE
jgi:hypothetical protein